MGTLYFVQNFFVNLECSKNLRSTNKQKAYTALKKKKEKKRNLESREDMIHRLWPQISLPSSDGGTTVKGPEVSVAGVSVAQVPVCTMPAPQSYYF